MSGDTSLNSFLEKKGTFFSKIKEAKENKDVEFSGSTTGAIAKAMETRPDMSVSRILVSEIYTEKQVREVNNDKVLEYASSIRGSEDGQPLQPITVWQNPEGGYLVIIGEHRYRAQLHNFENHGKKYESIYAIVRTGECPQGSDRRRIQLQENLQQNPMSDVEIALVVRDEMAAGTFSTMVDAVKWLHVDGADVRAAGTVRKTLSQVFSLLDDPQAADLVEAVHRGEIKPYKAKQLLDERQAAAKAKELEEKQAEVISLEVKRSNDRIAELEAQLEKSRSIVQQVENMDEETDFNFDDVEEYEDAEELIHAERERQIDIEEKIEIEKAKAEKAEKAKAKVDKPAPAVRFSLDLEQAVLVLDLLDHLASEHGLENLSFDAESLNRKQWDSIFKDRVPEIIAAVLNGS